MGLRAGWLRQRLGHLRDRRAMPGLRGSIPMDHMPRMRADLSTPRMVSPLRLTIIFLVLAATAGAQQPRALMPIDFKSSAEARWLAKKVQASRVLDDMTQPGTWRMTGTGNLTFPSEPRLRQMRVIR